MKLETKKNKKYFAPRASCFMLHDSREGFSLLEIIIAAAIMALLAALIFNSMSELRQNHSLKISANEVAVLLNEARSKTLASKDFSQYGVHFEPSRAVLFKGAAFSEPNNENFQITFPGVAEIYSISLNGGGNDVVFERMTGKTDNYGTIILRVKSDASKTKTIEIKSTGIINAQ